MRNRFLPIHRSFSISFVVCEPADLLELVFEIIGFGFSYFPVLSPDLKFLRRVQEQTCVVDPNYEAAGSRYLLFWYAKLLTEENLILVISKMARQEKMMYGSNQRSELNNAFLYAKHRINSQPFGRLRKKNMRSYERSFATAIGLWKSLKKGTNWSSRWVCLQSRDCVFKTIGIMSTVVGQQLVRIIVLRSVKCRPALQIKTLNPVIFSNGFLTMPVSSQTSN